MPWAMTERTAREGNRSASRGSVELRVRWERAAGRCFGEGSRERFAVAHHGDEDLVQLRHHGRRQRRARVGASRGRSRLRDRCPTLADRCTRTGRGDSDDP